MADSDKNILITPATGTTSEPTVRYTGKDIVSITNRVLDDGTLSWEGTAGQLFSITNSLTGTIFSVNDISGIPSLEILDTGEIRLAQYSGNVGIGKSSPTTKLDVNGTITATTFSGSGTSLTGVLLLTGGTLTGDLTISKSNPDLILSNTDVSGKEAAFLTGTSGAAVAFDTAGEFYIMGATSANILAGNAGSTGTTFLTIGSTGNATFAGNLNISKSGSAGATITSSDNTSLLSLNTTIVASRQLRYLTNNSLRWLVWVDNAAESGSNAGSNFYINRYDDSGNGLGAAISITRSTGNVSIGSALNLSSSQHTINNTTPTTLNFVKGSRFGYSTGYRVIVLGDTGTANNTSVAIGYDPVSNTNGSFTGNGTEVLFRNAVQFMTPNATNDNFIKPLRFDSTGNSTLLGVTLTTLTGSDTTDSTSSTTGAFKTAGGMGIAKQLYVGTNLILDTSGTPKGVIDLGNGTTGRAIAWGGGSGGNANYTNIWSSYSGAALVLARGLRGTTATSDGYVSSYGGGAMARAAIRLDNNGIQFFTDTSSTVAEDTAITPTSRMSIGNGGAVSMTGTLAVTSTISASGLAGSLLSSATPTSIAYDASVGVSTIPSRQDHTHPISNFIKSADTRNTDSAPNALSAGVYADFKANATTSLNDGGTYHALISFRAYSSGNDMSGGYPLQLGFTANNRLWIRTGTSTTTWGSWRTFVDTDSTQTVAGVKTFSTGIFVSGALSTSTSRMTLTNTEGGRLIIQSGVTGTSNQGAEFRLANVDGTSPFTFLTVSSTGAITLSQNLSVLKDTAQITANGSGFANPVYFNVHRQAGQWGGLTLTTSGTSRWLIAANTTSESGSDAGSNFEIRAYSDAGAYISTPLAITRSTGAVTLTGSLTGTTATFSGTLTVNNPGVISMGSNTGDRIMIYGAAGVQDSYGLGIESGTLYLRAGTRYRWYINALADGGTSQQMRLDANGLYPNFLNLANTADTTTAATHYYVETGTDGYVRPKTLANVITEIVTTTAVNAAAATTVGTITTGTWNSNNIDNLTTTHTLNIGYGATSSGNTKTINIGTNSGAGSTTNINIGSYEAGEIFIRSTGYLNVPENLKFGGSTPTIWTESNEFTLVPDWSSIVNIHGEYAQDTTLNLGYGATESGFVKTINIGTNSAAGSTTNIIIGSTAGTNNITLRGTVTASTATAGTNTTQVATTAFVTTAVASVGSGNPQDANAIIAGQVFG